MYVRCVLSCYYLKPDSKRSHIKDTTHQRHEASIKGTLQQRNKNKYTSPVNNLALGVGEKDHPSNGRIDNSILENGLYYSSEHDNTEDMPEVLYTSQHEGINAGHNHVLPEVDIDDFFNDGPLWRERRQADTLEEIESGSGSGEFLSILTTFFFSLVAIRKIT